MPESWSPRAGTELCVWRRPDPKTVHHVTQIAPSPSAGDAHVITGNVIRVPTESAVRRLRHAPRRGVDSFEPARLLMIDLEADALVGSAAVAGSSPLVMFVR